MFEFVLCVVGMIRVATQQGKGNLSQMWKMKFEKLEGGDRWTNPLMVGNGCNRGLAAIHIFFSPL